MKSLKAQMIAIIILISVLPMVLFTAISTYNNYNKSFTNYKNHLRTVTDNNAKLMETYFRPIINLTDMLSNDANVRGSYSNKYDERNWMLKMFDNIVNNYHYAAVYIGLKDKTMLMKPDAELPDDYDPTSRPWYKAAMKTPGKVAISDPYADASSGDILITVSKTVTDPQTNEIIGVIAIDLSIKELVDTFFGNDKVFKEEYSYLVNSEGITLMHSDPKKWGVSVKDMEFFKKATDKKGVVEYTYNGETVYAFYSKIADTDWMIYTAIPKKAITDAV
ncbi:cache domain-containing protein, partial [Marinitoga sp. 1138]|uniref:cache domain-containing protein n=1 Tax=Marinitoga sp. 1138 TaxID=1643334 RepID=UPI0015862625